MARKFLTGLSTTAIQIGTSATSGNVLTTDASGNGTWQTAAGGGSGNVVGPVSATDMALAQYDGTTGKLIKDGLLLAALSLGTPTISPASGSDIGISSTSGGTVYISASEIDIGGTSGGVVLSSVINMNSHKVTSVTDPTSAQDAATKAYVDSGTKTLTNTRLTSRINTTTSSATPAISTDTTDQFNITALATNITSMTSSLTGTPTDGQKLIVRFKDNGTARAITWGTSFINSGTATLLASTIASKTHMVGLIYDSAAAKWCCAASDAIGY